LRAYVEEGIDVGFYYNRRVQFCPTERLTTFQEEICCYLLNLMACYICNQNDYNWASFACIDPLYFTGILVAYIPGETLALSKIDVLVMK